MTVDGGVNQEQSAFRSHVESPTEITYMWLKLQEILSFEKHSQDNQKTTQEQEF